METACLTRDILEKFGTVMIRATHGETRLCPLRQTVTIYSLSTSSFVPFANVQSDVEGKHKRVIIGGLRVAFKITHVSIWARATAVGNIYAVLDPRQPLSSI